MNTFKKHALSIVVVLTAVTAIYAYLKLLLPLDVFFWDESHHGIYALWIFRDLQAWDWGSFWEHTNHQALWMPLHSWLVAVFLSLFGFSYASARLSSLFLFSINSILLYLIGCNLSKEKGWLIGIIAVICYLTSPTMLLFSVLNMQEMFGLFMCLITIYFMVRNIPLDKEWKFLFIGLLLSLSYWVKQNYFMALALGVGLYQLSLFPVHKEKHKTIAAQKPIFAWLLNNIYIFLGSLPLLVLWWATPPFERKYALTITFRQGAVIGGESIISGFIGTLAFYVKSFMTSYNLSLWIALGCLSAVIASFCFYQDKKIRAISLMFYANLFFISIMSLAQERYLSTVVPLAFILFGYFCLILSGQLNSHRKFRLFAFILTAAIFLTFIYDLTCLTKYTKEVANISMQTLTYKSAWGSYSPPFLFGQAKRPAFTFPIDKTENTAPSPKIPDKASLNDILCFFSNNIDKKKSISTMISINNFSPYVIYWHFYNWQAPVLSANDLSNPYFWRADYFLGLNLSKESIYYVAGSVSQWDKAKALFLKGGYIKLVAAKEFSDLGLTAEIYKREKDILAQSGH